MSTIKIDREFHLCTSCLICEESVVLSDYEKIALEYGKDIVKICDKCKKAVMKMRESEVDNADSN